MHHRLLLLLVFLLPHETLSGTTAAASCNRWCGGTNVPYPFGFSDGCPIALSCDANTSKPILPYRGDNGTSSYHVVSFNSTASSLVVSLPPSCIRSVSDVRKALSSRSYDVSPRTSLFLRGGCRGSNASAGAGCSVPASVMSRLLRTAQCSTNDTSTDVACVASAAPNATLARAVSLFWEKVEKQKCDDVLTSAVFMNSAEGTVSLEFKTAELGWWVNGTCAGGEAGGQCVPKTATCSDVDTPSGESGYRCACMAWMNGDGYAAGDGCYVDPEWAKAAIGISSAITAVFVACALVLFLLPSLLLDRSTAACPRARRRPHLHHQTRRRRPRETTPAEMDGSKGWNGLIEVLAFGDAVLLGKMKEIASWYDSNRAMVLQAKTVLKGTTEYERDWIRAAYGGDTRVGAMEVLLWCMSEAHGWHWDLTHKYEDYRSVMPADEVPDVDWPEPMVLPGNSVENPFYIREEGMPIPAPYPASPEKPYYSPA